MKTEINKDSPLYASIVFNEDTTEATVVLGTNEPRIFKSRLGVVLYIAQYAEALKNLISKDEFDNLKVEDFKMIKAINDALLSVKIKMPSNNEEDKKLFDDSPIFKKVPKVKFTIISLVPKQTIIWPMQEPAFEVCPHCGESGNFVDKMNPKSKSDTYYSKEDALVWLELCIKKGRYTKEQGKFLAEKVQSSKLAPTTAEFLAKQRTAEPCDGN